MDRVVDRNAEDQAGDEARGGIQGHSRPPEDPEVDQHRQSVRNQCDEAGAERRKEDHQDHVDEEELIGMTCWGGIDLSSTQDLSSLVLVFKKEDKVIMIPYFFSACNAKNDLRKENNKHTEDALMGEVAIKKGILLVTNDKTLKSRVIVNGGKSINLKEFKLLLK